MLSPTAATTGGVVLLTVVAIAYGGTFLLRVVGGGVPANPLQQSYFRAGHAHAGVLVILGLLVTLFVDLAGVAAPWRPLSGLCSSPRSSCPPGSSSPSWVATRPRPTACAS